MTLGTAKPPTFQSSTVVPRSNASHRYYDQLHRATHARLWRRAGSKKSGLLPTICELKYDNRYDARMIQTPFNSLRIINGPSRSVLIGG